MNVCSVTVIHRDLNLLSFASSGQTYSPEAGVNPGAWVKGVHTWLDVSLEKVI